MSVKLKTAVVAVVILGVLAVVAYRSLGTVDVASGSSGPFPAKEVERLGHKAVATGQPVEDAGVESRRSVVEAPVPTDIATPAPLISGRVHDINGQPVPGAHVRFDVLRTTDYQYVPSDEPSATRTDEIGAFEMPFPGVWGRLSAETTTFATFLPVDLSPEPPAEEVVIVVAPLAFYSGTVVDDEDKPLGAVALSIHEDSTVALELREGRPRPQSRTWTTTSGEDGTFAFEDVVWTPGLYLYSRVPAYEPFNLKLQPYSDSSMEVVLHAVVHPKEALLGRVVDSEGVAIRGGYVCLPRGRGWAARTDRGGRFALDVSKAPTTGNLQVLAEGYLPVQVEIGNISEAASASQHAPVVVRLEERPLSIRGVVLDQHDVPVEGAWVWTQDGTPVGNVTVMYPDGMSMAGPRFAESLIAPSTHPSGAPFPWPLTKTDVTGQFELPGRLRRPYTVHAVHPATTEVATVQGVEGGTEDAVIHMSGGEAMSQVAGRVLFQDGTPAAGVNVFSGRRPTFQGRPVLLPSQATYVTTDEEGRFRFDSLCTEGAYLHPTGTSIARHDRVLLAREPDLESIEIRVRRLCRFQVVLLDQEEATSFSVLDEFDKGLQLRITLRMRDSGGVLSGGGGLPSLVAGRSEIIEADETACTIVLRKEGEEVRRLPIRLTPGEIQILRL